MKPDDLEKLLAMPTTEAILARAHNSAEWPATGLRWLLAVIACLFIAACLTGALLMFGGYP